MNAQYVICPSGHRLRANPRLFGQTHPCPKCGVEVSIPAEPKPQPHPLVGVPTPKKTISDSSFMRVLGSCDALPPPPQFEQPQQRACPRCSGTISVNASVCEHCHCYAGRMPDFLRQMVKKLT